MLNLQQILRGCQSFKLKVNMNYKYLLILFLFSSLASGAQPRFINEERYISRGGIVAEGVAVIGAGSRSEL